jgi:hypothetical protein
VQGLKPGRAYINIIEHAPLAGILYNSIIRHLRAVRRNAIPEFGCLQQMDCFGAVANNEKADKAPRNDQAAAITLML